MICKTFEIRDSCTFIPVLAVQLKPECEGDRYLLARAGFGREPVQQAKYVVLTRIAGGSGQSCSDPYNWDVRARTFQVAHQHIIDNFDELPSGAVVDVEFLLGERPSPKQSESITVLL